MLMKLLNLPMMNNIIPSDKDHLFSLFENMEKDKEFTGLQKSGNSDILLVDFYNLFIRSFMAIPTTNENGLHVGGIAGFLKTLGAAIKLISPSRVIVVIDGPGGSVKRRKIYPDYKSGRKTSIRLNRSYEDISDSDSEESGRKKQLIRTVGYLDTLPVTVISIDNVEADDVIAYLAVEYFKDKNVYIASCDKDFLQLVNDNIKVWSPSKKKLYGCAEVFCEYGVSCKNFLYYRVLEGDTSDNIDGIKGAGLKTILKCFPFLTENVKSKLDEIYNYSENNKGKYKLYTSICENKNIVERNYSLMQLFDTQIPSFSQLKINEVMGKPLHKLNKVQFLKFISEDKMHNNLENVNSWLSECFGKLDYYIKS
jgi:5'-3' exonuclease